MAIKQSNMILVEGSEKDLSTSIVYSSNVRIFHTDNGTFKKGNSRDKYKDLQELGGGSSVKEGTAAMLKAGKNKEARTWSAEKLSKFIAENK